MTTEDAENKEESQKYPSASFRVVRVFRGYPSRWLRAERGRNHLTAILTAQNACINEHTQLAVENLFGSKQIQL